VPLTAKDVAEITRLLEESSFDELYLELDGMKLSLRRSSAAPDTAVAHAPSQPPASLGPTALSPVAQRPHAAGIGDPNVAEVPAPLLGTFYRAPKPGAAPFVEVDSVVEEDTIIGIIEVMKLMNTVRAGAKGRVTEILARDGVLVEFGETLLRISKTG